MFHLSHGIDEDSAKDFESYGGADPRINPRVAALFRPDFLGRAYTDRDILPETERSRHPFYQDILRTYGVSHATMGHLMHEDGMSMAVAAMRPESDGRTGAKEVGHLGRLMPELAQAVRLSAMVERREGSAAVQGLESVGAPAFFLDHAGRIVAMTAAGEAQLRQAALLKSERGVLRATDPAMDLRLSAGLWRCRQSAQGTPATVSLHPRGAAPVSVEIRRLGASEEMLGFGGHLLVVLNRSAAKPEDSLSQLCATYGLTPAEAQVALALGQGLRPARIADMRGVSIHTIRHQIRVLLQKTQSDSLSGLVGCVVRLSQQQQ
ncbi:transcriptional regulator,LuxR family [Asticcacaulis biprosthecium C19]|uniref:Transcriptional regulator,LuxR family n=1 Tax=Asticcacaulis biprosthecium C19 TaxID=715226 RepID=F4QHK0_9CAUL|nr:transcriptional regulator,LuxR family [Asticcacaulis biprosthecium C19]